MRCPTPEELVLGETGELRLNKGEEDWPLDIRRVRASSPRIGPEAGRLASQS